MNLRRSASIKRCCVALHLASFHNGASLSPRFTPLSGLPSTQSVQPRRPIRSPLSIHRAGHNNSLRTMSTDGNSSGANPPNVDFSKTATVGSTRWMRLETLTYRAEDGSELKWDRAVRTTKRAEDSIDAVVILAILQHDPADPSKDEIVCVKQVSGCERLRKCLSAPICRVRSAFAETLERRRGLALFPYGQGARPEAEIQKRARLCPSVTSDDFLYGSFGRLSTPTHLNCRRD